MGHHTRFDYLGRTSVQPTDADEITCLGSQWELGTQSVEVFNRPAPRIPKRAGKLHRTGRLVLDCVTGALLGASLVFSGCALGPSVDTRSVFSETEAQPNPVEREYEPMFAIESIPGAVVPEMSHSDLATMLNRRDFKWASVLDKAEIIRRLGVDGLRMVHVSMHTLTHEQYLAYLVYESIPLQVSFKEAEMPKVRAFSKWLDQSQEVQEIRNDWTNLDDDRRLKLLRAVHEAQASIFGFEPCSMSSYWAGNDVFAPGKAGYHPGKEELEINFHPDLAGEPEDYVVSVIHESAHRQQHMLALAYTRGEMASDDPRLVQTVLFAVNHDAYIPAGNMGRLAYLTNPLERHAYWLTDAMGELLGWPGCWHDEKAKELALEASQL